MIAALVVFLSLTTAEAAEVDLFARLPLGTHRVGFHQTNDAGVWAPAREGGTPMRFADYLSDRGGFEKFLSGAGLSAETIDAWMQAPMRAFRDAPFRRGRFPLIVVAQGNQQSAADQAVLCELIASHGYVVVTTPSPMLRTPMQSEEEIGAFAETQAAELVRAIAAVSRDAPRIGVVGHSFGSRAVLLLAMREPRVRALVSLDGGIGSAIGVERMRAAASYRAGHAPPILHFYELHDSFVRSDLSFLRELGAAELHTERIDGMRHAHFTSLGFAAAALPELAQLTRAPETLARDTAHVAAATLRFLDLFVKR